MKPALVCFAVGLLVWLLAATSSPAAAQGVSEPLAAPGDAARGRVIVATRTQGLCLLCHSGPFPEERFQGTLAPDLRGVGARLNAAQLRQRMIDSRSINPDSIMPAYFRASGLNQVGSAWRGQTLLSAQQIEDVVAFLSTLRE